MNPAEMVVAIVMIVVIGAIVIAKTHYRAHADTGRDDDSAEARRLREEVRALKDRIQVLERLATDDNGSARLDREIEKLRDRTTERTRHD